MRRLHPIRYAMSLAIISTISLSAANAQESSSDELVTDSAQADVIRDVFVPIREAGILERIVVQEGDWVKAGDSIAELDKQLYDLELQAALMKQKISETKASDDIDTRYSTKSKEVAGATLNRSTSAVEKYPKSITETEIEQLKLELERATLSIEKSIFDRKLASYEAELNAQEAAASKVKLVQRSVRSPIDGLVVEVLPQEGEWLNTGQSVARVVQLDRMRIKALLPSNQINQSFVGRRAVFESSITGQKFEGKIHFVSPEVVPSYDKIQFWFDVENPGNILRRGESGRVRVLPESS